MKVIFIAILFSIHANLAASEIVFNNNNLTINHNSTINRCDRYIDYNINDWSDYTKDTISKILSSNPSNAVKKYMFSGFHAEAIYIINNYEMSDEYLKFIASVLYNQNVDQSEYLKLRCYEGFVFWSFFLDLGNNIDDEIKSILDYFLNLPDPLKAKIYNRFVKNLMMDGYEKEAKFIADTFEYKKGTKGPYVYNNYPYFYSLKNDHDIVDENSYYLYESFFYQYKKGFFDEVNLHNFTKMQFLSGHIYKSIDNSGHDIKSIKGVFDLIINSKKISHFISGSLYLSQEQINTLHKSDRYKVYEKLKNNNLSKSAKRWGHFQNAPPFEKYKDNYGKIFYQDSVLNSLKRPSLFIEMMAPQPVKDDMTISDYNGAVEKSKETRLFVENILK